MFGVRHGIAPAAGRRSPSRRGPTDDGRFVTAAGYSRFYTLRRPGNDVAVRRQTGPHSGITVAYSPNRQLSDAVPVSQSRISASKRLLSARYRRVRRGNEMNDENAIKRASSREGTGIIGRNVPERGVGGRLPPDATTDPGRTGSTRRAEPHCGSATRSSAPYGSVECPGAGNPHSAGTGRQTSRQTRDGSVRPFR